MAVTEDEVLTEIREQLAAIKVPEAETAAPSDKLLGGRLDVDSLDLVELVKGLEDRFEVTINDDELKPIETVGDAIALVVSKANDSKAA